VPLQDPNVLSMVGLGTLHDLPPNPLQPKHVDAVHLRAFRPDLGFPWHGFYLYRRNSKRERGSCIGGQLAHLPVGPLNANTWNSGIGIITSDQPLVAREDFRPTGVAEFDLTGRTFREFITLQIAYSVELQIGFRKNPQRHPRCLDFAQMRPQSLASPCHCLGIDIQTLDRAQKPVPHNEIVRTNVAGHATSAIAAWSTNANQDRRDSRRHMPTEWE
jgi:hypothetical protein